MGYQFIKKWETLERRPDNGYKIEALKTIASETSIDNSGIFRYCLAFYNRLNSKENINKFQGAVSSTWGAISTLGCK